LEEQSTIFWLKDGIIFSHLVCLSRLV